MALLTNPYTLNWKAATVEDQLESTRALDWDLQHIVWSGHSTGQRMLSSGSAANLTRDHVAWAARCRGGPPTCRAKIREAMAATDLVARSLILEPAVSTIALGASGAAGDLPRKALVEGMVKSRHILSWAGNPNLMLHALTKAIRTDPSPEVRLEVLSAISLSPIPLGWTQPLIDAMAGAEATLAQTPFRQEARVALAHGLSVLAGKLQDAQRTAAMQGVPGNGVVVEIPPSNVKIPQVGSRWKAYVAVGGATVLLISSVLLWRHRHSSGVVSGAVTTKDKRLSPTIKAKRMISAHGQHKAALLAWHREDHAKTANEATYWSKVAQQIAS